jgi:protein gp37
MTVMQPTSAFYFKQWGGTNKKKAGKILEGKIYNQMPETIER